MNFFTGGYELKLDSKGRVMLPAAFRKDLPEGAEEEGFVLNNGPGNVIYFYTKSSWDVYAARLQKLNEANPKALLLKRMLLSGATKVELDGSGRFVIPKLLKEYAGLQKDVVFTTQNDKMVMWDKERYVAFVEENMANLADLQQDVLGGDFIDPLV